MRSSTLATLGLATFGSAAVIKKRGVGGENVLYWGANDNEQSLATYCNNQGVDIVIMGFLSNYGNGVAPTGYCGNCLIDTSNDNTVCSDIAADIQTCQAAGVKVFMSIGGGGATGSVQSTDDANGIAYTLWNSFASPSATSGSPRPFGDSFVNGWDFDIESNDSQGNQYYGDLVNALRGYFSSDSSNTYYISGAPQCVVPDANMNGMISSAQFDYLFLQFYNTPECAAYQVIEGNDSAFTFDAWYNQIQGTSSSAAKLIIGLPAAEDAADSNSPSFYIQPSDLPTLINEYGTHAGYGGVGSFDGGASDELNDNGCHYDQEIRSVMDNGTPC